jgi:hypothetical protein
MSMESRFRYILAAFGEPVPTAVQGAIFRSPAPIDLPASLGPALARRLVSERNELLIEFGAGRMSADGTASLGMLRVGRAGGVICVVSPCRTPVAVAALRPATEPSLISAFLLWFMARNGATFGIDFLHGLPPWIRNLRPDLLDRPAVRRALRAWMAWAHHTGATSWERMRAHVIDRWGDMTGRRRFPKGERRELLEMYLTTSYFELPDVGRHTLDAQSE